MIKKILILLLPFSALGNTLSDTEIAQLIDSVFHSDSGSNSPIKEKSNYRWERPQNVFIGFDKEHRVQPKQAWLDLIKDVCNEISQLTDIKFNFYFDISDWDSVREKMQNGGGITVIHFLTPPSSLIGGLQGRATTGGQSVRIYINTRNTEKTISHVIREELINSMSFHGDTWRDQNSIFWQGGDESLNAQKFSETDRKVIYAYYAMDKNSSKTQFTLVEFMEEIKKVQIDQEKVYGGLFENQRYLDPANDSQSSVKESSGQTEVEHATPEVDWLYFQHYPWVYSAKKGEWHYFHPHGNKIYIWSQKTKVWAPMKEALNLY